MELSFDYSHMLAANLGPDQGLTEEALASLQPLISHVHQRLEADLVDGRHQRFGFMDLPETMAPELDRLRRHATELWDAGDDHVILGIGGSYLGARMLFEALCHHYHNHLDRGARRGPRIWFEGNGLDNDSLADLFQVLEGRRLTAHVVSKSGGTLETAVAYRLLRALNGHGARVKRWVVTTGAGQPLEAFFLARGGSPADIYHLPRNVGGRYSVLTSVGLLPAAVMGLDPAALLAGAAKMRAWCATDSLTANPAYLYAALQHLSCRAGRHISVMAVWDKALEAFGLWYDQLCAESLGQLEARSRTPLTAVCTRELHSRGQQHQQGPSDKVICNLVVGRPRQAPLTIGAESGPGNDNLGFVEGRPLPQLNAAAAAGTDTAYAAARRPGMTLALDALDAEMIGGLVYLFELATVVEGLLMAIDPLDQPGVEAYKKLLNGLLGNPKYEAARAEYEAWHAQRETRRSAWS
jgi:glucose-6-phosphate isomerase